MTTGWIIVNILLSVAVSSIVAAASVMVPRYLDRDLGQKTPQRPAAETSAAAWFVDTAVASSQSR